MDNLHDLLSTKVDVLLGDDSDAPSPAPEAKSPPTQDLPQEESHTISTAQVAQIHSYLATIESAMTQIKSILGGEISSEPSTTTTIPKTHTPNFANVPQQGTTTQEGVFNGHAMVGSDGKSYPVPPNYASKSKLIEGDLLKVTVTPNGTLIYKQIGPIERERKVGELVLNDDGSYCVVCDSRPFSVLTAAITYHKGIPGNRVVILVPKDTPSKWAAVEYLADE